MNEELGVATRSQRQSFKDHENNSELYFMAKSEEELRSLLMKVKDESEKVGSPARPTELISSPTTSVPTMRSCRTGLCMAPPLR